MRDTQLMPHPANSPQSNTSYLGEEELLLGRYRVLETRAQGGFGCVKICWDRRLTRRVAIKCMPLTSQQTSMSVAASSLQEALQEARMTSIMSHPNIVSVHDFEVQNNTAYLVMEYIDGLSMTELMARVEGGVLTYEECAHILDSVAQAISYAHEQGVLHLDIKPSNIMIDRNGRVKLADFGMATLSSATGFADARGGTVGYMPPEQIEGNLVDERSDVFSLAVVMWQALSGISPFGASTAEASLSKILKGPKPALSKVEPPLVGVVENTLKEAMAPDPAARLSSAEELADILVMALGDADAGQASLIDLLQQTDEDDLDDVPEYLLDKQAPLEQVTWAWPALKRVGAGILCALIGFLITQGFSITTPSAQVLVCGIFFLAGVSFASLGAILSAISLCIAAGFSGLAMGGTTALWSCGIAALFTLVFVVWWSIYGREHNWACIAFLLPLALNIPFAGIPAAIYALGSVGAGATTIIAALAQMVLLPIVAQVKTPVSWGLLAESFMSGHAIIALVGYGAIAAIGALLQRKTSTKSALLPQIFGGIFVIFVSIWAKTGQNSSLAAIPQLTDIGFAVILFGLMFVTTVLLGPDTKDQEADLR